MAAVSTHDFSEIQYEGITLRQMLTHTSGLPEQNELMYKFWNSGAPVTNRDMVKYLIKYKPAAAFKPGEGFKYCNTNYSLLAMIVEKVRNQKFQDFPGDFRHGSITSHKLVAFFSIV